MKRILLDVNEAVKIFEILASDDYHPLWGVISDFVVNGHKVSVMDTTLWHHVIIDDGYVDLKSKNLKTFRDGYERTFNGIEFAAYLLSEEVTKNDT